MKVSLNFMLRITGMLVLAYLGAMLGISLSNPAPDAQQLFATRLLMLAGAGLGLLVTPRLTLEPLQNLLRALNDVPLSEILFVTLGGFLGLVVAVLLTLPLGALPPPISQYAPLMTALICAYIGAMVFASHRHNVHEMARLTQRLSQRTSAPEHSSAAVNQYLLDTSTIIDGRVAEVVRVGFLSGKLVVPQIVLGELQSLADSSDDLKRSKGRRGLELLNQMQNTLPLPVEILNMEALGNTPVDDSLVVLARRLQCPIITNDFNLNRVAALQGVQVLSLNQLSDAVRPPVYQDQRLQVFIRNEGNARQQGVGYLDDGTPVIVEDARHLIGQMVTAVVTRLHQTQTGRLVFAQLAEDEPREQPSQPASVGTR